MKKSIKTALVFIGGAVVGITLKEVASKTSDKVSDMIAQELCNALFDDEREPRKTHIPGCGFSNIEFNTGNDAEEVLHAMRDIIDKYGVTSVAVLYDMSDMQAPHMAIKYGWTKLDKAKVVRVRGGYILDLPRAVRID